MEQQNLTQSPTFVPGDDVLVEGQGPGTISDIGDDGFYVIDLASGDTFTASLAQLTKVEAAREDPEDSAITEPPSVFEELGKAYDGATEDRRETFPILPGRFKGNLAMRARPVDSAKRKKKVRRMMKRGGITDEAEAQYAASLIADACDSILVRLNEGEDYKDAHTISEELGTDPVRFDQRLGKVIPPLGRILTGNEQPATIVRLLFKNMEALDGFYVELDQWLKEASPTESDEDDGEADTRPS
jgi:hypothetical protein